MTDSIKQKYSGAGNKFIILDDRVCGIQDKKYLVLSEMDASQNSEIDGVIFLENSGEADFKMNYFNRDGTCDSLCGNGLRCTAQFISDNNISDKKYLKIEAVGKIFDIEFKNDGNISVSFPPPKEIKFNFPLKVTIGDWWKEIKCSFVDIGSDHIVIFTDDIPDISKNDIQNIPVNEWGRVIRMHRDLLPDGANVNFVKIEDAETENLSIRTYERGVERETLACGTGAISSAIASYFLKNVVKPVNLKTKSGEILTVDFEVEESIIKSLTLTGGAERITS